MLSPLKHGILTTTTTTARYLTSSSTAPAKQTIFSGIQPTGIPHLGNYLGALRQWVNLQNDTNNHIPLNPNHTVSQTPNQPPSSQTTKSLLFCIVDLHALTTTQTSPAQLRQFKKETLATLLAIGLDPKRSTIFHQSDVPAHAEMHWLLSCTASMGYLSRMTQWKSKLGIAGVNGSGRRQGGDGDRGGGREDVSAFDAVARQKLKLGLFSYPVLQAADILVHGATHVPVGEDQVQHIEFARECAGNFNAVYSRHADGKDSGDILVEPIAVLSAARRVMSLTNPGVKMSKSAEDAGSRILLTDERDVIERKIRGALTDSIEGVSYDVENRPGVSNLVDILVYLAPEGGGLARGDLLDELRGVSLKGLKGRVVNEVDAKLAGIRERIRELLMGDGRVLDDVAEEGAAAARKSAEVTLDRVKNAVGLR